MKRPAREDGRGRDGWMDMDLLRSDNKKKKKSSTVRSRFSFIFTVLLPFFSVCLCVKKKWGKKGIEQMGCRVAAPERKLNANRTVNFSVVTGRCPSDQELLKWGSSGQHSDK